MTATNLSARALVPSFFPRAWPLAMADLDRIHRDLVQRYPDSWVRFHLESMPASYFEAVDESEIGRHLELMRLLSEDRPVVVEAKEAGARDWVVNVVGYDAFQFLSTLCCLLAVRGYSIQAGRIFTSSPRRGRATSLRQPHGTRPSPPRRPAAVAPHFRPRIVDVLRVSRAEEASGPTDWGEFERELTELTRLLRSGQLDEVHERLVGRMVAALERFRPRTTALEPIELEIDLRASDSATIVRIGAADSFGFLYLTTSALALCGIPIAEADIRTQAGRVHDTFWVTDRSGWKIEKEARLRELRLSLILIEHFSSRLAEATDPAAALMHFSRFAAETMSRPDWVAEFAALDRPEVLDVLVRVLGESRFLWEEYLHARPDALLPLIVDPGQWDRRRSTHDLTGELGGLIRAEATAEGKQAALRRFGAREIFRADVRSILGRCGGLEGFSAELSDLAEVLLSAGLALACQSSGREPPKTRAGQSVPATLFGLGKLGGRELGFASDLELILVYDAADADAAVAAAYFDAVVSALRSVVGGRSVGTFELDLRLRPYGRGGQPATSLRAFSTYYRAGGPAWSYERQALVKLRSISGDAALGSEVENLRDQFVYGPEPFDLEGMRRMRRLQIEQLVRPGNVNAKYSAGGLVDVEYFVQALQIAQGGQDASLRVPSTMRALSALETGGYLNGKTVETLRQSYQFFRVLIDELRVVHGHARDLEIPAPETRELALLARRMRSANATALLASIESQRGATRGAVEQLAALLGRA